MSDGQIHVRSYRAVFKLERRIHRVDRFAIPVPGGIPLRGLVYFVVALLAVLAAAQLPGIGWVLALAPLPLRLLILPAALAVLGTQATPDGRAAHRFARAWIAHRLRPAQTVGSRAVPRLGDRIVVEAALPYSPDENDPALHRSRVHGPARIAFRVPITLTHRRRRGWRARPADSVDPSAAPAAVTLAAGERLEIRP